MDQDITLIHSLTRVSASQREDSLLSWCSWSSNQLWYQLIWLDKQMMWYRCERASREKLRTRPGLFPLHLYSDSKRGGTLIIFSSKSLINQELDLLRWESVKDHSPLQSLSPQDLWITEKEVEDVITSPSLSGFYGQQSRFWIKLDCKICAWQSNLLAINRVVSGIKWAVYFYCC